MVTADGSTRRGYYEASLVAAATLEELINYDPLELMEARRGLDYFVHGQRLERHGVREPRGRVASQNVSVTGV